MPLGMGFPKAPPRWTRISKAVAQGDDRAAEFADLSLEDRDLMVILMVISKRLLMENGHFTLSGIH